MSLQELDQISDESSFQRLFQKYYRDIRNYLYYRSGDMGLSEDLAQETFLIVWEKRDQVDPEKVRSFLYTIAGNLFLNEVKHQKVVLRFQQRPSSGVNGESPQFLMEEEEFRQELERMISGLPEKTRVVFLMNRIEKQTYQEIAEQIQISVKAVEKRMHKALTILRKLGRKV